MRNRIKELREARNLRQSDLASAVEIDQRTISNYETGKTNPDSYALIRLADFFEVSIDYLVAREGYGLSEKKERAKIVDKIKEELEKLR